jgi:protoporphyrin/coproporphyrin ferrochelatase
MKGSSTPVAIVLVNLGTPEELTVASVRSFLREFLSDARVVEIPRPIWLLILNLFVLPFRPKKVVETYRKVWAEEGSPLRIITEQQVAALQQRFDNRSWEKAPKITVCHAMTYGNPGISETLEGLYAHGYRRIVVLPMYPQYSGSTTGAIYDQLAEYMKSQRALPGLSIINSYFYEQSYISALRQSIENFWQKHDRPDYLLFSYHGIPVSYVEKGDPYAGHCECTTAAVLDQLELENTETGMAYQSLFGKAEWLKPYTSEHLAELAKQGVKKVDVICPGFAADCIETLEEIALLNAELFVEAGGEELRLIPCLNDSDIHIDALEQILDRHIQALAPSAN